MVLSSLKKYLARNETLSSAYSGLLSLISAFEHSAPVQMIINHKKHLSIVLNLIWIAVLGYWVYTLVITDVSPDTSWGVKVSDSRDATVYLFFGFIGFFFAAFMVFFTLKFIYNLFHGGIRSIFSIKWYSIAKPVSYLLVLGVAFSFTENIKIVGVSAYEQVRELVQTSRNREIIINRGTDDLEGKINSIIKALEKDGQEDY